MNIADQIDFGPGGAFYYTKRYGNGLFSVLYRSFDEGITWEMVNDSVQHDRLSELASGTLISWGKGFGSNEMAVWRSTDNGQTWAQVFSLPQWSGGVSSLRTTPGGDLMLESGAYNLVYHSVDDGQTWQEVQLPFVGTGPLYITPSGAWFAKSAGSIQRTVNGGQSWEPVLGIAAGEKLSTLTVLPNGRLLAAGSENKQLYYSDDDGVNWQISETEYSISALKLSYPISDGSIFGTSKGSLYRSTDGGTHWSFAATGLPYGSVYGLSFASTDMGFATTRDGLWRTLDQGQSWQSIAEQKRDVPIDQFFPQAYLKNCVSIGQQHLLISVDSSVLISSNWGTDFTDITPAAGLADIKVKISPGDSILFANCPSGLCRSDDGGANWQLVATGHFFSDMVFHPSGRYIALLNGYPGNSSGTLWASDNFGRDWQPLLADYVGVVHISPDGKLYTFTDSGLAISEDAGAHWILHPAPSFIYPEVNLFSNAAGHLFLPQSVDMFRSLDDGISWQTMPSVFEDFPDITSSILQTVALRPDQFLFAAVQEAGLYRTVVPSTQGAYLSGHVRKDADADCSTADAQEPLADWAVEAKGNYTFFTTTDVEGAYRFFIDTGEYALTVHTPQNIWWTVCGSTQNVMLDSLLDADTLDFAAVALAECPLMTVDVSIPRLRRCMDNYVHLTYCNQGSETADSAWVDVSLDAYMTLVNSAQPYIPLGNNEFRFYVGTVESGHCGQFYLSVYLNCDSTILGQTHCVTAHGYPDTLCTAVPNWSGAEIQASVSCQDTSVQFHLTNTGQAPSQLLDYIVIEDDVVLMQDGKSYQPGEGLTLDVPANGHTWRIESEQEPGHPFSTQALAFSEGCGGFQTLGFINQFNVDAFTPSWDQDCVENTGSYDPNDKQGFPLGTGDQHLIRPGQELEYQIRFQNTGTDTAFTVVVRDTLSPWLDPASVRPGASSHPYTWTLSGNGVLSFTFNNIQLPDSNVNEATSHGFISFRIAQQADVPLDAVIYNEANIYFDFNAPVVTNKTWHTVGVPVTVGLLPTPENPLPSDILVTPQPATDFAVFQQRNGQPFRNHRLYLSDALGHVVRAAALNGGQCRIEREELAEGLYFFRIEQADGRPAGSGRLAWQR